jgi:hypothetical protein
MLKVRLSIWRSVLGGLPVKVLSIAYLLAGFGSWLRSELLPSDVQSRFQLLKLLVERV